MTLLVLPAMGDEKGELRSRQAEIYEKLSANCFAIYTEIQSLDLSDQEKKMWLQQGAAVAFNYWLTTRKGDVEKSPIVERGIALMFERASDDKMAALFEDPLLRIGHPNPEGVGVVGFPKIKQEDYLQHTKEFYTFLNKILEERQKRKAEQAGAGQPATRSESGSEVGDKLQPESEGRSR